MEFFNLNLDGPFDITTVPVDAGCVQDDAVRINEERSFRNLQEFYENPGKCLENETRWLEENRIDLVVSDVASRPLKAGQNAGIPAVLIANFTWHDIYSHFPGAENHTGLLKILEEEYAAARLQILPQCHIENSFPARREEVGFIARKGKNVRRELEDALSVSLTDKTLVFIYLGESGKIDVEWNNLEAMEDCLFLTRDALPPRSNLFVLDGTFRYQDLIASSDIVCTKAGYSTLGTAFAHGKPVITCSREHFCEFAAVREFLIETGVGVIVDSAQFYSGRWAESIKKAREITVKGKVRLDGEIETLRRIENFLAG